MATKDSCESSKNNELKSQCDPKDNNGYDDSKSQNNESICSICLDKLTIPVIEIKDCDCHYDICVFCAYNRRSNTTGTRCINNCPHSKVNKYVIDELQCLELDSKYGICKCPKCESYFWRSENNDNVDDYRSYEYHKTVCPKMKIYCPQKCGKMILRCERCEHINSTCVNTRLYCPNPDCKESFTRGEENKKCICLQFLSLLEKMTDSKESKKTFKNKYEYLMNLVCKLSREPTEIQSSPITSHTKFECLQKYNKN